MHSPIVNSAPLLGSRLKLQRATSHLQELDQAVAAYIASKPFRVQMSEDASEDLVYTVRIAAPVPSEWAAIIGDIVHNVRSSLDLLANQLVATSGGAPDTNTRFPISRDQTALGASLSSALQGASPAIARFVNRLHPYKGGNALLAQLHALDIVDKHRIILVVGAAHRNVVLRMQMSVPWQAEPIVSPPLALKPADRQFPLGDGDEVFRVKAQAKSTGPLPEPQFTFELCFGEPTEVSGLPLLPTLRSMHEHVSRIVDIADRFLI